MDSPSASATPGRTVWSGQLELTAPSVPAAPRTAREERFDDARILIRSGGAVLGFVEVALVDGEIPLGEVMQAAHDRLSGEIAAARHAAEIAADQAAGSKDQHAPTTTMTVAVCTRNRPDGVSRCVQALARLRYQALQILIVDNAPGDDRTEALVTRLAARDERIRYVREPRPGLSCARNRAIAEAGGEIVAFTDDDVRVDELWLQGVLRGFERDPSVACVTGLVASASLEHPAEQWFDGRVSWSSNCRHALYVRDPPAGASRLHPWAAGAFGTGANCAFRLSTLRALGGFDECLGAGSPTQGGEDLDIFVRVLRAGHALSYEPDALVWHDHRVDDASLRGQMHGYGKGLAAYLTKYLISRRTGPEVRRRLIAGVLHAATLARRSKRSSQQADVHAGLLRAEIIGLVQGPGAYLVARRRCDRHHLALVAAR